MWDIAKNRNDDGSDDKTDPTSLPYMSPTELPVFLTSLTVTTGYLDIIHRAPHVMVCPLGRDVEGRGGTWKQGQEACFFNSTMWRS